MEDFVLIEGTQTLASSREQINNALMSVRSLSSGTSFPIENLVDGMLCYRTDEDKLYQYKASRDVWTDKINIVAQEATNAQTATSATKLATARTINNVPFDGTADINIISDIAHGGTGATTAEEALENLGAVSKTNPIIPARDIDLVNGDDTARISAYEDSALFLRVDNTTSLEGSMVRLFDDYFSIRAGGIDNEDRKYLYGQTSGSLTWNNKRVLTEDQDGLEISKGQNGYIRDKKTGFTIQWGRNDNGTLTTIPVTFPRAFSVAYTVVIAEISDHTRSNAVGSLSTTGFTAYLSAKDYFYWIAIGVS